MRNLLFFTLGLILISCSSNVQPKEVEVKYPKEYIIVVRYTDNVVDTINYISRDNGKAWFQLMTVEEQSFLSDIPIEPTLIVEFHGGMCKENIAVDVKSYKIIKEIY